MKAESVRKRQKPDKPHPDFPLTPHPNGSWCKKVRGKVHFFGPWGDPDGALDRWLEVKDELLAGRTPSPKSSTPTLKDLANLFLTAKESRVVEGLLTKRSFDDYHETCARLLDVLGGSRPLDSLAPSDFIPLRQIIAKGRSPSTINNEIGRVRVVLKFAYDEALIDRPIRGGHALARVQPRVLRKRAKRNGPLVFTQDEMRAILGAADFQMRAMILLGLNAGFGNTDCGLLRESSIDFDRSWLSQHRSKTGTDRQAWLWPETAEALREAIRRRYRPAGRTMGDRVFVTKRGESWAKETRTNPVSQAFTKLTKRAGCYERGKSFYTLRRMFETYAGETADQPAVDLVMGHLDPSMAETYRQYISDERVIAVCRRMRDWLYGEGVK